MSTWIEAETIEGSKVLINVDQITAVQEMQGAEAQATRIYGPSLSMPIKGSVNKVIEAMAKAQGHSLATYEWVKVAA